MSIIIKGMDMPKEDNAVILIGITSDGKVCEWDGRKKFDRIEAEAIQIPTPHGRLIDMDELLSHLSKDPLFDLVERYGVSGVIESRPTILEAEE